MWHLLSLQQRVREDFRLLSSYFATWLSKLKEILEKSESTSIDFDIMRYQYENEN